MRYNSSMTTTNHDTLTEHLTKAGFVPARWDSPSSRQLDRKNGDGFPTLRVCMNKDEGSTKVIAFTGTKAQIVEWQAEFSSLTPTETVKAAIFASL